MTLASADGRVRVDLVEHLFAALGGLGVSAGVHIAVDGDELPLLDGGALGFAEAILALDIPREPATRALVITRRASIARGAAVYELAPGPDVELRVDVEFRAPVGRESAAWRGDAADFLARIAPARTFGWADEHAALLASARGGSRSRRGPGLRRARRDPRLSSRRKGRVRAAQAAGLDRRPRDPRRPSSRLDHCVAPGHAATHAVVAEALALGVLAWSDA